MAKVQVKHIIHYREAFYSLAHLSWFYVCVYLCVLNERKSFCSFFRDARLCLLFFFFFALTHALSMCMCRLQPRSVFSLYYCAGPVRIVHAKPFECAAMIMVQGQECRQQRWELVIFKSSAQLPWLLLNVNTTVKHCSEPRAQLHSATSKTNSIPFSIHAENTLQTCLCCGR